MNKKLFGIKISTYLQFFVCLIVAFCVWFFVKYFDPSETNEAAASIFYGLTNL